MERRILILLLLIGYSFQEYLGGALWHSKGWDADVGMLQTGEVVIYDAGSYYAYNEMELGIWRVMYAKTLGASAYKEAYLRLCLPPEPANEWDDRNWLYSFKCNLNWSFTNPGIITRIM